MGVSSLLLLGLLAAAGAVAKPTRCVQDEAGCVQCSANGVNCVACDLGFAKINGACVKCRAKMLEDGLVCDKCDKSNLRRCERCFYTYDPDLSTYPTRDGSCAVGKVADCHKAAPVTGRCTQCSAGFYLSRGRCVTCPTGCTSCNNKGRCLACTAGRGLVKGPRGPTCKLCASRRCDKCNGNVKVCKKCGLGYGLSGGACRKCNDAMCATCNPAGACLRCLPGMAPVGGKCKPCSDPNCVSCPRAVGRCTACQNGKYADRKTGKCGACGVFNCDACNSSNAASCDECKLGFNRVPMPSGDYKCLKQLSAGNSGIPS